MPLYYLILKNSQAALPDREGIELADDVAARGYAEVIARELMRNNEVRTRSWKLEVRDAQHATRLQILFADLDTSIDQLPPPLGNSVRVTSQKISALSDSIGELRNTLLGIRATLAQADRAPYLAAVNGRRVTPPNS
jgi:hypothetical protein